MAFMALLLVAGAAIAQEQPNLGLIPTPQQVVVSDSNRQVNLHTTKVKEKLVATLPVERNAEQGYVLEITPKSITLKYSSDEGRQYGYMTLSQLRQLHTSVPSMVITDWPAYRLRGWHDDQSRGPVPHDSYRERQWNTLHALKYNFCNYYTEHTLYQREYPDLAPAYAATNRFPDEQINLQLFAHAEKTLRVPYYEHLKDSYANFAPDNEEVFTFLQKRIAEAVRQNPTSPYFIINCDETEQLGTGRAREYVERTGSDEAYVRFINRCCELIKPYGKRVAMWGDIVAKNPSMMQDLPSDMIYIMWAYSPLDSYDHLIRPFQEKGNTFWVAPSLSHSSNMCPNPYTYMTNIANLARDGYRAGAEGLMNTCWDDNGEALFDNCWHGLYWSAEMAWNPLKTNDPEERKRREEQFNENFEKLFYGGTEGKNRATAKKGKRNVDALYRLGTLESTPIIGDWYTSAPLMEPLLNFNPENTSAAMRRRATDAIGLCNRQLAMLDSANNPHVCYALHRIRTTALKALLRLEVNDAMRSGDALGSLKEQYLQALFDLKREYLRLWDQENGEYERYIVCNRFDQLAREVLDLEGHVFMQVVQTSSTDSGLPKVQLSTLNPSRTIYYTLDGSEPTSASTLYNEPFALERSATIRAITYNQWDEPTESSQYILSHKAMGKHISLATPFATYKAIYSGGGAEALIDGQLGSNTTYADGHWQGYWGDSIDATIDFGATTELNEVRLRFMQNTFDWILSPSQIILYTSADGVQWHEAARGTYTPDPKETGMRLRHYHLPLAGEKARFLRVVVPNREKLPAWHPAPGQAAYLFCDEIIVL